MVSALGYCSSSFDPRHPGRLCRGRERWIEPFDLDEEHGPVHRLVVTGASFTDDSAADALRGLHHSGFDLATILTTVFTRKDMVAFMEDGHPADIPEAAVGVEMYSAHRAGGRSEALFVRWFKPVSGLREIRDVLGPDVDADRVRGFALLDPDTELDEELMDAFFLLTGMSNLDSPPGRFQPSAIPFLLDRVKAIVLIHRDKHGPAVGVYSREPLRAESRLIALCERQGTIIVRFAIPPMLARWDRALSEARAEWEAAREEPFPVPAAPESAAWQPRRRSRRARDAWAREAEETSSAAFVEGEEDDLEEEDDRVDGEEYDDGDALDDGDDLDDGEEGDDDGDDDGEEGDDDGEEGDEDSDDDDPEEDDDSEEDDDEDDFDDDDLGEDDEGSADDNDSNVGEE